MTKSSGVQRKISDKLQATFQQVIRFWQDQLNDWWGWFLLVSVVLGSFFRLYNIPETVQFLGDQGRDSLVVAKMFTELDPVFIGPVTSVGNLYLGPLYYYFMLPFLWLTYPSPLGPAYAVALLSCLTIFLLFYLGQRMVGRKPAIIGTFIFSFSYVYVSYSRFSWNPNPAPLVSLLLVYFLWKALNKAHWYWILVGLCFVILLQLHYLTLLLAVPLGMLWLKQVWHAYRNKSPVQPLVTSALAVVGLILISYIPIILFDVRHDWLNLRALGRMFFGSQNFAPPQQGLVERAVQVFNETHGRAMHLLFEVTYDLSRELTTLMLGWFIFVLLRVRRLVARPEHGLHILTIILGWSVFVLSTYQHTVFNHYISFLWPITALLSGYVIFWSLKKFPAIMPVVMSLALLSYLYLNIPRMPIFLDMLSPRELKQISQTIISQVGDSSYSLVQYSDTGEMLGLKYRYFLYTLGSEPISPDQSHLADYLVVILEKGTLKQAFDEGIYDLVVYPNRTVSKRIVTPYGPEIVLIPRE